MTAISSLAFPQKSHRKSVVIPPHSPELAEFFGIMIGDGGINNPWQANITLNSHADALYAEYVRCLVETLFGVSPSVRLRPSAQAIIVSLASTTVVDFLVTEGLCRGNKLRNGISVPAWIKSKKTYKMACVRGLIDTDGCMILHRRTIAGRTYRNIYMSFSSASPALLGQVLSILKEGELRPTLAKNGREVFLYRQADVERYMQLVGTSNPRIQRVYETWRDG